MSVSSVIVCCEVSCFISALGRLIYCFLPCGAVHLTPSLRNVYNQLHVLCGLYGSMILCFWFC
jgi:hypothetical protein